MNELFPHPFDDLNEKEAAVLSFTSDRVGNASSEAGGVIVCPTKDAIIWSVCIERFCSKHRAWEWNSLEKIFVDEVGGSIGHFLAKNRPSRGLRKNSLSPYLVPLSDYASLFGLGSSSVTSKRINEFKDAERSLEEKALIKDPFLFGVPGAELLIFGLIPYDFSFKTEEGAEKVIKMKSLLWEIEYEKENSALKLDLRIRVFKLANILRGMFIEHIKRIEKDDDV
nr:hypothetical protein [uncultured Roseibium sp.]